MCRRRPITEEDLTAPYTAAFHRRQRIIRYAFWCAVVIAAILGVLASL